MTTQNNAGMSSIQSVVSTFSVLPAPTSLQHFLAVKLSTDNYLLWESQFIPLLKSYGLMGYADGTNMCPEKFLPTGNNKEAELNPAFIEWEKMDQLLLGWLISSLTDVVHSQIVGLKTSHEVWSALRRMYAAHSRSRIQRLRAQLQSIRKGTDSIANYFHKVKGIVHQLALASKPVDNDDLMSYILAGLPTHEYGALRTSLNTRVEQIELEELLSLLLIHEAQCEANEPERDTVHIANIAYGNQHVTRAYSNRPSPNRSFNQCGRGNRNMNAGRTGTSRPVVCHGCGNPGHMVTHCRTICQACRQPGHSALRCKEYHFLKGESPQVNAAIVDSEEIDSACFGSRQQSLVNNSHRIHGEVWSSGLKLIDISFGKHLQEIAKKLDVNELGSLKR
ncbi:Retrovirus-related Pol polyprotein from transposon TNT 1-94 [Nymphaea thermarum]|nr:Retrovirus-related Pol polyprotein from transposon TNT 1-94 [Nymphaea thermarum]